VGSPPRRRLQVKRTNERAQSARQPAYLSCQGTGWLKVTQRTDLHEPFLATQHKLSVRQTPYTSARATPYTVHRRLERDPHSTDPPNAARGRTQIAGTCRSQQVHRGVASGDAGCAGGKSIWAVRATALGRNGERPGVKLRRLAGYVVDRST
jgi:hypothetical protein